MLAYNISDSGHLNFTLDFAAVNSFGIIYVYWEYNTYVFNYSDPFQVLSATSSPSSTPTAPSSTPTSPSSTPAAPSGTPTASTSPQNINNKKEGNNTLYIGVGIAVGVIMLIIGILLIVCLVRRRNNRSNKTTENVELTNSASQKPNNPKPSEPSHYEAATYQQYTDARKNPTKPNSTNKLTATKHTSLGSQWEINFEELELQKEIGSGAYGRVYVGNWRQSKVAVKVLKTQLVSNKDIQEFEAEAALMMRLRPHRNVVQLLGICTKPPNLCMVMEYLDGGSLADYCKSRKLSESEMIDIAKGIAAGMYHLACEKIVHRDLAARNILMATGGIPKVSDFGMSRVLMTSDEGQTQSFVGPIKWMAPESIRSREYSEKSDVWSYGIVLWEITHRSLPHPNVDLIDAAVMIRNGHTPEIAPTTPSLLSTVMVLCWKLNAADRPSFNDICNYLAE